MGKLDATMVVNGPEDVLSGWDAVDWQAAEEDVRRLRQRIFAASRAGDLRRVRNLQKLMLRSRSAAVVSVRRVTEVNAGRKTAGVDGRVVLAGWYRSGHLPHQICRVSCGYPAAVTNNGRTEDPGRPASCPCLTQESRMTEQEIPGNAFFIKIVRLGMLSRSA